MRQTPTVIATDTSAAPPMPIQNSGRARTMPSEVVARRPISLVPPSPHRRRCPSTAGRFLRSETVGEGERENLHVNVPRRSASRSRFVRNEALLRQGHRLRKDARSSAPSRSASLKASSIALGARRVCFPHAGTFDIDAVHAALRPVARRAAARTTTSEEPSAPTQTSNRSDVAHGPSMAFCRR